MRVLLTTDTVGGVWTYALELSGALSRGGVEVVLATLGAPLTDDQWAAVRRSPDLQVYESSFKLEWMEDPWDDVRQAGEWLLGIEQSVRPDVVHLNTFSPGALPWRAPKLVVGHSCVLSWWEAVKGEAAPPAWDRYRGAVTHGLRAADLVTAPTGAMLADLQRFYGPLPRARVIPNGRGPVGPMPPPKQPLILAAGRVWDEAKNIGALEAVAHRLAWPICVAGEAEHPDGRQAHYRAVRQLGRLAPVDLASWLGWASIYALPARYEPFGLSILEAALAGCSLLIGDIPSLREVWGSAATFVPPEDPEALTAALAELIANPAQRRALAARAYDRALELTPHRMAEGYLRAYRDLVTQDRGGPATLQGRIRLSPGTMSASAPDDPGAGGKARS